MLRGGLEWLEAHASPVVGNDGAPIGSGFGIAREAPEEWACMARKAVANHTYWSRGQLRLSRWRRTIYDVCAASDIAPPATREIGHPCQDCGAVLGSKGSWRLHRVMGRPGHDPAARRARGRDMPCLSTVLHHSHAPAQALEKGGQMVSGRPGFSRSTDGSGRGRQLIVRRASRDPASQGEGPLPCQSR
eukprot:7613171-Pyramimonas_sp.AAC.1